MNRTVRNVRFTQGTARQPLAVFLFGLLLVLWVGDAAAQTLNGSTYSCSSGQVAMIKRGNCSGAHCAPSCALGQAVGASDPQVLLACFADQFVGPIDCQGNPRQYQLISLPGTLAVNTTSQVVTALYSEQYENCANPPQTINGQSFASMSYTVACEDPEPEECPEDGTSAGAFSIESSDGFNACLDEGGASCSIRAKGVSVAVGVSDIWYATEWVHSGESCGGAQAPVANNDCETVNGNQVCKHPSNGRCIVINGEDVCSSDAGGVCAVGDCLPWYSDDEVAKLPDGAQVAYSDTPTPPAPNNGTEGQRADPDLELQAGRREGGPGQVYDVDYWNAGTVGNSTADSGNNDGDGEDPNEEGNCFEQEGGEPCTVKIDEEGTPSEYEGEFDYDPEETAQDVQDAADDNPAEGVDWSSVIQVAPAAGCQSVTFQAWGLYELVFPGTTGCGYIEDFWKPALGWLLWMLTAFYVLHRFFEEI